MCKVLKKIIWIGNPYFMELLPDLGWEVTYISNTCAEGQKIFTWNDLVTQAGFEPDVLIVGDNSMTPFQFDVEDFPCLTVFYCVDTHVHFMHFFYAQSFDICLVSLYDHIPLMKNKYLEDEQIWWFPPYSPSHEKIPARLAHTHDGFDWDCLFVGNLATPTRVSFFNQLKEYIPTLHVTTGDFVDLFPRGRIIINEAARGDLNFRVFEAMGCGSCLVTPLVGHNSSSLFEDGVHLSTYPAGDAQEAAKIIQFLLDNPKKQEEMRQAAFTLINNKHRDLDRASEFSSKIKNYYINGGYERMLKRRENSSRIKKWLKLPYLHLAQNVTDEEIKAFYMNIATNK